jgi:FMN-dependent NADH-azoreductase
LKTLLYIQASPRRERGKSVEVSQSFLKAYRQAHPNDEIDTLDLWAETLPDMSEEVLNAKYRILHGEKLTAREAHAWAAVEQVISRFKAADKFLFSVPMWNFGIPYRLKHYVDLLVQPGYTFTFDPEAASFSGLVTSRRAAIICSRGNEYPDALSHLDHQTAYMKLWMSFVGITDVSSIVVEPTMGLPERSDVAQENALQQARVLARTF